MRALVTVALALALLAPACSGGKGSAASPTTTATPTTGAPVTSGTSAATRHYVSLGDSYSAGQGLPLEVQPCGRAPGAYPSLVATRANLVPSLHACNGATTADVLSNEQAPGAGKQIDAVTPDADIVTITIGGNDIGFASVMTDCVLGAQPCTRLLPQVTTDLAALGSKLDTIYAEIHRRAPHATLVVVGYPQLVVDPASSPTASCAGLTPDESRFVRQEGDQLALVVKKAADAAGARYVDTAARFAGHEACTAVPWMEGVNLVDISASFHPNAAGQEQLAQLVLAALPDH